MSIPKYPCFWKSTKPWTPGFPKLYRISALALLEDYAWQVQLSQMMGKIHLILHQIPNLLFVCKFSILSTSTLFTVICEFGFMSDRHTEEEVRLAIFSILRCMLSPILCVYLNPQIQKHKCKIMINFPNNGHLLNEENVLTLWIICNCHLVWKIESQI